MKYLLSFCLVAMAATAAIAQTPENTYTPIVRTLTFNGVEVEFIAVRGGSLYMGASTDPEEELFYDSEATDVETPVHIVTLSDFWISKYPVTQRLWEAVTGLAPNNDLLHNIDDTPYYQVWNNIPKYVGDNYPAFYISYLDVKKFCNKLAELHSYKIRIDMPTEAQWEYAARGGKQNFSNYKYSGSDNYDDVGWVNENSYEDLHEVGQLEPNQLGIYDMTGNVQEWCKDNYARYDDLGTPHYKGITQDPCCQVGDKYVLRGGAHTNYATHCRTTYRSSLPNDTRLDYVGARLVLNGLPIDETQTDLKNIATQSFIAVASNGIVNVRGAKSEVRIFNLLGRECAKAQPTGDGYATIDISALPQAIYIVRCASNAVRIANN